MSYRENRRENRRRLRSVRDDSVSEQAALTEFLRSPSVAALASAIAKRLGGRTKPDALLAEAGLAPASVRPRREINTRVGIGS